MYPVYISWNLLYLEFTVQFAWHCQEISLKTIDSQKKIEKEVFLSDFIFQQYAFNRLVLGHIRAQLAHHIIVMMPQISANSIVCSTTLTV